MVGRSVSPSGLVRLSEDGRSGVVVQQIPGLCTWCGQTVPPRRQTWCSERCVRLYRLTQPACLRQTVHKRDKGSCASCATPTDTLYRELVQVESAQGGEKAAEWLTATGRPTTTEVVEHLVGDRRSLWDMDHIQPVAAEGDPFDLGNLRTLCYWCHKGVTKAFVQQRARKRRPRK